MCTGKCTFGIQAAEGDTVIIRSNLTCDKGIEQLITLIEQLGIKSWNEISQGNFKLRSRLKHAEQEMIKTSVTLDKTIFMGFIFFLSRYFVTFELC